MLTMILSGAAACAGVGGAIGSAIAGLAGASELVGGAVGTLVGAGLGLVAGTVDDVHPARN